MVPPSNSGSDSPADSGSSAPAGSPITPAPAVRSALPSPLARGLAFVSILVAGLCGALIGFAFADLQCTGDCGTWQGVGTIVGAVIAAGGVAIVAILTLRAMDEWETVQSNQAAQSRRSDGQ